MRSRSCLLALAAIHLLACVHLETPDRGGPSWLRTTSPHFVVAADVEEKRLEAAVAELELRRGWLSAAGFPDFPDPPGRIDVVLLRTSKELAQFSLRPGFCAPSDFGENTLVLVDEPGPARVGVLQLTVAEWLIVHQLRSLPVWLAVGYGLLSTVRPDGAGRELLLGESPFGLSLANYRELQRQYNGSGVAELGGWPRVHYLATERPVSFRAYLQRLRQGERPDAAFAAAFATATPQELAQQEEAHLRSNLPNSKVIARRALPPPPAGLTTTERLTVAEVHALFARLYRSTPSRRPQAERDALASPHLERALALDPDEPTALLQGALQKLPKEEQWRRLRELAKKRPSDARPLLLLAVAEYPGSEEREQALRQAVTLEPALPFAFGMLAQELLRREPKEALVYARRASALAPWSAELLALLAAALAATGSCDEALAAQSGVEGRTVRVDGGMEQPNQWVTESLAVVRDACGK